MKVKFKLFLALLFLFGVILLLGGIGSHYLRWLARDSAAIMKDNNRTLSYMRSLEEALDAIHYLTLEGKSGGKEIQSYFDSAKEILHLQSANITEPGEKELTDRLRQTINLLVDHYQPGDTISQALFQGEVLPVFKQVKEQTRNIYLLNEKTMLIKNDQALATAEKVVLYMRIFGVVSILVGLVFIIALPIYISRPIATFNNAIKEIAQGNYKVAIPSVSQDEYGELADSFNKMAARLDEYEHSNLAKLIREQKRLNAVINQLDEVVLGLDEGKKVIFANEHCLKLLDLERHHLIGKYAPDVATQNQLLSSLIKDLMTGDPTPDEKKFASVKVVEDNKEKLFSKNIVVVIEKPAGDGKPVLLGHVVILTDITAFMEKDKAKTHFIATLSHELKTPVAAIQMGTNLLKNKKSGILSAGQHELITTIENNNKRIGRIINEILDLSRIESGTIDITLSGEPVPELIEKAVEGVQLFLAERHLSVKKEVPSDTPLIKVDAHKTVWVLNNFLTNAIRYAPVGSSIEINAECTDSFVKIEVHDHGPGITQENQKQMFQKFTRLVQSESSGTGLGLAISKEFIEAMGGTIGVSSEIGKGSRFWIQMPRWVSG